MSDIGKKIYEPSKGDIVYQYMGGGRFEKVQILDGEYLGKTYGRLSNFWKWRNLETGEIEEDYGCFYKMIQGDSMMEKTDYDYLIQMIEERLVEVPPMRADQLAFYMHGWTDCQQKILNLLEQLKRDNAR